MKRRIKLIISKVLTLINDQSRKQDVSNALHIYGLNLVSEKSLNVKVERNEMEMMNLVSLYFIINVL